MQCDDVCQSDSVSSDSQAVGNFPGIEILGPYRLLSDWPVRVECCDKRGRFLVASRDIAEGELVLRSDAFAGGLMRSHRKRVCRHCLAVSSSAPHHSLYCRSCWQVYWCSEACRAAHLNPSAIGAAPLPRTLSVPHGMVCAFLKQLASCKFDIDMESVYTMLAEMLAAASVLDASPGPCQEQSASLDWQDGHAEVSSDESRTGHPSTTPLCMQDFLHLEAHVDELKQDPKDYRDWAKGARLLMRFLLQEEDGWGAKVVAKHGVSEDRLIEWASMILCNNFALNYERSSPQSKEESCDAVTVAPEADRPEGIEAVLELPLGSLHLDDTRLPEVKGSGGDFHTGKVCGGRVLYISASFFNHSCRPNCANKASLTEAQVVAIVPICAGDELCLSYIDTDLPRSERRKQLNRMFFFDCDCPRCAEEQCGKGSQKYSFLRSATTRDTKPKLRGRKARQKSRY
uniref:SET domain-containing protein n=1 Tax=Tetraselmis chuii TaxID=63592 RepID=A0A7S1X866_9CHLO|mmetsp:Transcript_39266/g.70321  ORF Transcript_39266/g.70321 Transcript_39266/m.70321 type:complete len:457 (+) Transcript_39266:147-1517(+)